MNESRLCEKKTRAKYGLKLQEFIFFLVQTRFCSYTERSPFKPIFGMDILCQGVLQNELFQSFQNGPKKKIAHYQNGIETVLQNELSSFVLGHSHLCSRTFVFTNFKKKKITQLIVRTICKTHLFFFLIEISSHLKAELLLEIVYLLILGQMLFS